VTARALFLVLFLVQRYAIHIFARALSAASGWRLSEWLIGRALALQPDFLLAQNRLIELIALGWLPPVDGAHSSPLLPGLEHSRERSKSLHVDGPAYLGKPPKGHLSDSARGRPENGGRGWGERLESSIASHWLPIVTTIALVLTVMVMVAPLLENNAAVADSTTRNSRKTPPSSPKLKGKGRGRK